MNSCGILFVCVHWLSLAEREPFGRFRLFVCAWGKSHSQSTKKKQMKIARVSRRRSGAVCLTSQMRNAAKWTKTKKDVRFHCVSRSPSRRTETKWRYKMAKQNGGTFEPIAAKKTHTHSNPPTFYFVFQPIFAILVDDFFFFGRGGGGRVCAKRQQLPISWFQCVYAFTTSTVCVWPNFIGGSLEVGGGGGKLHLRFILMSSDWLSAISAARASVDSIPYSHRSSFVLFGWVFFRLFVCLVPAPPTGKKKTNEDRHPLVVHR